MEIPAYIATRFQRPDEGPAVSEASTGAPIAAGLGKLANDLAEVDIEVTKKVGEAARLGEYVARKGALSDRLGALEDSLTQDSDHRTYFDRAKKGIEEATTEALAGVNDPELKNALTSHVSSTRDRFLLDARHKARTLTVDFAQGALDEDIERNIQAATSATDAMDLIQFEGNIESSIRGAVRSGILSAVQGEKARRGAREKIVTVQAEQMADQEPARFLANNKEGLYKDVDPLRLEGIRRYATNRSEGVEAWTASGEVWEEFGPKRDEDPTNEDLMVRALETKFAGEPDKAKLAIASLKEKTFAHDKGVKERKDANLSAVWKASLAGKSLASIIASPEYSALDGGTQRQVKEHLEDRSWAMKQRSEVDPGRKAAQHELYWRYSQPEVLSGMTEGNITALYPSLGVELTDKLVAARRGLDNPSKMAEAKIDADDFNHFARAAGIVPEKKNNKPVLGEIKFQVENAIDAEQRARGGKPLSREEKAKIMRRGLVEVPVRVDQTFLGMNFGPTVARKRFFDVQYKENVVIPPAEAERIGGDLAARGLPVTDDNVLELYLRMREK